jgi:hypothetical protein
MKPKRIDGWYRPANRPIMVATLTRRAIKIDLAKSLNPRIADHEVSQ